MEGKTLNFCHFFPFLQLVDQEFELHKSLIREEEDRQQRQATMIEADEENEQEIARLMNWKPGQRRDEEMARIGGVFLNN
jgi:ribosomal protein RSM22 (predicted rRNA methylase)